MSGVSVLLVEDQPEARETLQMLIEIVGHRVHAVGDAEAALQALAADRYDVLMTDLTLPGLPGQELVRRARTHDPKMHLLVASGHSRADAEERGGSLGDVVFAQKPIDNDWLINFLDDLAKQRAS